MKKYTNIVIAVILLIILAILMTLIKSGNIMNFDNTIYNFVTTNTNTFLDNMYKFFTFFGSTLFVVLMCSIILIFMKKKKTACIIVGCVIISTTVNTLIKIIFQRERPLVRHLVEESTFSFPSGHTATSITLYGILIFFVMKSNMKKNNKIIFSILLGILPVLIAISRIYLGVHFASDIIGAVIVSTTLLLIETFFINKKYTNS